MPKKGASPNRRSLAKLSEKTKAPRQVLEKVTHETNLATNGLPPAAQTLAVRGAISSLGEQLGFADAHAVATSTRDSAKACALLALLVDGLQTEEGHNLTSAMGLLRDSLAFQARISLELVNEAQQTATPAREGTVLDFAAVEGLSPQVPRNPALLVSALRDPSVVAAISAVVRAQTASPSHIANTVQTAVSDLERRAADEVASVRFNVESLAARVAEQESALAALRVQPAPEEGVPSDTSHLEQRIAQQEHELQHLVQQSQRQASAAPSLAPTVAEQSRRIADLERRLHEESLARDELAQQNAKITQLEQRLHSESLARNELAQQNAKLAQLEQRIAQSARSEITSEIERVERASAEREDQLLRRIAELEANNSDVASVNSQLTFLQAQQAMLEASLTNSSANAPSEALDRWQREQRALIDEIRQEQHRVADRLRNPQSPAGLKAVRDKQSAHEQELAHQRAALEHIQNEFVTAAQVVHDTKAKAEEAARRAEEVANRQPHAPLLTRLTAMETAHRELQREISTLRASNDRAVAEITTLRASNDRASTDIATLRAMSSAPREASSPAPTAVDPVLAEELARVHREKSQTVESSGPRTPEVFTAEEKETLRRLPTYRWRKDDPHHAELIRAMQKLVALRRQLDTDGKVTFAMRLRDRMATLRRTIDEERAGEMQTLLEAGENDNIAAALCELGLLGDAEVRPEMLRMIRRARIAPEPASKEEAAAWASGKSHIPVAITMPPTRGTATPQKRQKEKDSKDTKESTRKN